MWWLVSLLLSDDSKQRGVSESADPLIDLLGLHNGASNQGLLPSILLSLHFLTHVPFLYIRPNLNCLPLLSLLDTPIHPCFQNVSATKPTTLPKRYDHMQRKVPHTPIQTYSCSTAAMLVTTLGTIQHTNTSSGISRKLVFVWENIQNY